MPSINPASDFSARTPLSRSPYQSLTNPGLWQIRTSPQYLAHVDMTAGAADILKQKLSSSAVSSSTSSSSQSESDSTTSSSCTDSDDETSNFMGGNVPKLSLPILYEDEENPITVAIGCRRCLEMESILRNFTQLHVNAFVTCREKKDKFWEFIINWNKNLQKNLDSLKAHLIGEFISHIDQASLTEFKEDHDFRVQFNHYRLIYTHLRSMENRLNHRMQEVSCPLRDLYNINVTDKVLKDLQLKITATRVVLQQLEQRIQCIAKSWDNARSQTNPQGFRQAIFTKEDYIFNRLCNIFICLEFLEREGRFYEAKAQEISMSRKRFIPTIQLKSRLDHDQTQWPKSSNVKRVQQNSVKRKLPSTIAHMYPLTKPQTIRDVHTSWFRTFLRSEDIKKEISQQRDTNMRVLTDIQQLKQEIHHLETQLKLKEFADQNTKWEMCDFTMFPEKVCKAPCFLDFNKLF